MPAIDVVVETKQKLSVRARQVCGMFDCPPQDRQSRQWQSALPIENKDWNVGLIVGPSGSGKTTCARHLWPKEYEFKLKWSDRALIDDFPTTLTVEEIAGALNSVGFSTIPAWLRPFSVLSNGEQFRATIARRLLEQKGVVVIDEFTSVVDRQVATVACHSVQKHIRKNKRQLVAITCHNDVIEWLQPDWVFEPATCEFTWRCLRRRPTIAIEMARLPHNAWDIFAPYHYLTNKLHRVATCFGLWANGELAGFSGVLHRPHGRTKNIKGLSRIVVLPDWQGLGLAFVFMETLGAAYKAIGQRFRIYPAHPPFVRAVRNPPWRCDKKPGTFAATEKHDPRRRGIGPRISRQRPCAVFEYVGDAMDIGRARQLIETKTGW